MMAFEFVRFAHSHINYTELNCNSKTLPSLFVWWQLNKSRKKCVCNVCQFFFNRPLVSFHLCVLLERRNCKQFFSWFHSIEEEDEKKIGHIKVISNIYSAFNMWRLQLDHQHMTLNSLTFSSFVIIMLFVFSDQKNAIKWNQRRQSIWLFSAQLRLLSLSIKSCFH